ncbi:MAG: IclR family transcriptional regulator [Clostridia bacterium]|nr:IclR family transcriptional regulator [Clostridia bacterium]
MTQEREENKTGVRAVERAADVLLAVGDKELGLAEISRETGLSKATTYRILHSLERKGFIMQDRVSGRYSLGSALLSLVSGALYRHGDLVQVVYPAMQRLWRLTKETITLYVRQGSSRICVAEIPSPQPLKYTVGVGVTVPLHAGAPGKLLLAYLPDEERERILDGIELEALTRRTITARQELEAELVAIRAQGWAASFGERIEGVSCLSVPVRDAHGEVVACLSILGPYMRLGEQLLMSYLGTLQEEADRISTHLGVVIPRRKAGPTGNPT